jgi:hypothetical protein
MGAAGKAPQLSFLQPRSASGQPCRARAIGQLADELTADGAADELARTRQRQRSAGVSGVTQQSSRLGGVSPTNQIASS